MKTKVISLIIATTAFCLFSCENNSTLNKTNVELHRGETFQLEVVDSETELDWTSTNEFCASVSDLGLITAHHIGETTITSGNLSCAVKVLPKIDDAGEPIVDFNASTDDLIAAYGEPYAIEESGDEQIYYFDVNKDFYGDPDDFDDASYTFIQNELRNIEYSPCGIIDGLVYLDYYYERYELLSESKIDDSFHDEVLYVFKDTKRMLRIELILSYHYFEDIDKTQTFVDISFTPTM